MPPRTKANNVGTTVLPSSMKELKDTPWKVADKLRGSASDIRRHEVAEVPHEASVEFGRWADAHLEILGTHRSENRTLTDLRDTLLPQLMSGNLRVKDAEKVAEGAV